MTKTQMRLFRWDLGMMECCYKFIGDTPILLNLIIFCSAIFVIRLIVKDFLFFRYCDFQPKTELELPPLEFYPILGQEGGIWLNEHCLSNVSSSADPVSNPDNYVVVAFYTNDYRLAFIRGQKHWTPIISEDEYSRYSDVFYKGQVYALENQGVISSFQVNSNSDMDKVMAKQVSDGCAELSIRACLVESTKGDLLLVQRLLVSFSEELGLAESFQVYKLLDDQGYVVQQVEVESIEDEARFVGNNNSVCVLASNFPGCQPNSIYFTDDSVRFGWSLENHFWTWRSQWDMGIFNFDYKTITQLHRDQNSWDENMPHHLSLMNRVMHYEDCILLFLVLSNVWCCMV